MESESDVAIDSDFVDEETEFSLYSAVYYEDGISPSQGTQDLGSDDFSGQAISIRDDLKSTTQNNTSTSCDTLSNSTSLKFERRSAVRISTFEDQSSTSEEDLVLSSAVKEKFDSRQHDQPLSSPVSSLDCSLSFGENTSAWGPEDVILGASFNSVVSICNPDDSKSISKRLSKSSNDPDLWQICTADRFRTYGNKNRYFDYENDLLCQNCKRKGHSAWECQRPGPACILCGEEGHQKDECDKQYCYACLAPGHSKSSCTLLGSLKRSVCQRCGQQGHVDSLCTELWRQYRNTTRVGKPIPAVRSVRPRGCCNCGRRGHCVDDCICKPFRSHFVGPLPRRRVLVYDKVDIYRKAQRLQAINRRNRKRLLQKQRMDAINSSVASSVPSQNESVKELEQSVNKRLLDKVINQEMNHLNQSKEISHTDEHYLPLVSNLPTTHADNKNPKFKKKFKSRTSQSPFTWINKRTVSANIDSMNQGRNTFKPKSPNLFYISDDESYVVQDTWPAVKSKEEKSKSAKSQFYTSRTCPSLFGFDHDEETFEQCNGEISKKAKKHKESGLNKLTKGRIKKRRKFSRGHRQKLEQSTLNEWNQVRFASDQPSVKRKKTKKIKSTFPNSNLVCESNKNQNSGAHISDNERPVSSSCFQTGMGSKHHWLDYLHQRDSQIEPWDISSNGRTFKRGRRKSDNSSNRRYSVTKCNNRCS